MKVTGEGIKNGAIGLAILAGLGAAWWGYKKLSGLAGGLNNVGEQLGGSLYTAINGDPNATLQSNVRQFLAAWKAAGSPAAGSPSETALRQKYGIPLAPGATGG